MIATASNSSAARSAGIRAFAPQDIPEVARLWQRCFRHSDMPASPALLSYFQEVFFNSPWADESLPSLLYHDRDGRIIGFIGVLPRPMLFQGQPIRAAIATQLMFDPDRKAAFAPLELMRRFFAGGQDLSFSDGANKTACALWQRCGGQVAPLYCMEWRRILRPAQHLVHRLRNHPRFANPSRSLRPLCRAADAVLSVVPASPYRASSHPPTLADEPANAQGILACMRELDGNQSLKPRYDLPSLTWLLRQAGRARSLGELRCRIVRDPGGLPVGFYVYYVKPGAEAQALHIAARPGRAVDVLACLFRDAWRNGAASVAGGLDPRHLLDFPASKCGFTCPGQGVLVHSPRPEILSAIHRGDAILTRLEGEWWLRLGIDRRTDW